MDGAKSYDSNEKKSSGLSQRPVEAPTEPSAGRAIELSGLPWPSKTFSSDVALRVYCPISFPPAAAMDSKCTSLAGTTSRQCSRCGVAKVVEKTCHWGAFQFVRMKKPSPATVG